MSIGKTMKNRIRVLCLLVFGVMACLSVMASASFHKQPEDFHYRSIRSILRDHKGLMWFGTESGLVRYDGRRTYLYAHEAGDEWSIPSNVVNALMEDKEGRLWVGTTMGLSVYDRKTDRFVGLGAVGDDGGLLGEAFVASMAMGKNVQGRAVLWVGTLENGVFWVDLLTRQVGRITLSRHTGSKVTAIVPDNEGGLWIGTQEGLAWYDLERAQTRWFQHDEKDPFSLSSNVIGCLARDDVGDVWVGTLDNGLNRVHWDGNAFRSERLKSGVGINCLYAEVDGVIWAGTENDGLYRWERDAAASKKFRYEAGNEHSLGSNSIWSIYGDAEGRLWLGTYNKGVHVLDPFHSKLRSYYVNPYAKVGLPNNDVKGFCTAGDGQVWIGTDGGGIVRFHVEEGSFDAWNHAGMKQGGLTGDAVQSMVSDVGGSIWLGTWGDGVDHLDSNGRFLRNYRLEQTKGVGNNKLRVVYRDVCGRIWAGTNGSGLFVFRPMLQRFEPVLHGSVLNEQSYVTSIASNDSSRIWVGTLSGLVRLDLDAGGSVMKAKTYSTDNADLHNHVIFCLLLDREGLLWMGTQSSGVVVFDPVRESFRTIRTDDGLPSNFVSGLVEDDAGLIWVSTNAGIARMNQDGSDVHVFTMKDGLRSHDYHSKSVWKTEEGLLLFGSSEGFDVLDPDRMTSNPYVPRVLLTDLTINGMSGQLPEPIGEMKRLELNHNQTTFSIHFVATNYTRPGYNRFAYRLKGYDSDWNVAGSVEAATYTKVRPGTYTFEVKAANNDGLWSEEATRLTVVVKAPFWKTPMAYTFYALLLFGFVFVLLRLWKRRLIVEHQLLLETQAKAKNLAYFTHISHEFRTPLSLILAPVESLMEKSDEASKQVLTVIQQNADRLLQLTNNLMDIRKLEAGATTIERTEENILEVTQKVLDLFHARFLQKQMQMEVEKEGLLDLDASSLVVMLDAEKYQTILINLLSNALKYSPEKGMICLSLNYERSLSLLKIRVSNTGEGIPPSDLDRIFDSFYQSENGKRSSESGTGIGLALTKGLLEQMDGTIAVESNPDGETVFECTLPAERVCKSYEETLCEETQDGLPIVLIVEDQMDLREFLQKELTGLYAVYVASNGMEGLAMARELSPDLIVSDVAMPEMDGVELCRLLKTDVQTSHIPFVLLTAKTTTEDQLAGFESGADAYVMKPFHLKLLKTQIANLIHTRKELYAQFAEGSVVIPRQTSGSEVDQLFLQKTIDYVMEHIAEDACDAASLAKLHHMSHRTFYRKLKALTGNTVVEFVRIIRLKHALMLIESKRHSLSEIAYLTGFSSPSYFTKSFKEYYGKTPSEFIS